MLTSITPTKGTEIQWPRRPEPNVRQPPRRLPPHESETPQDRAAGTAKASVRRTTTSAQSTSRAARTASKQAGRATARRVLAEKTRFEAVARQAERVILIPVGAALEARDRVAATIRTYSDSRLASQQLNRFERRGATVLRRKRRAVERQAKGFETALRAVRTAFSRAPMTSSNTF